MRSEDEHDNPLSSSGYRDLRLLNEVDGNPELNQRQLSIKLGIALGLTNVLVRSLIQKGYLRVSKASWKRRFYNLTPDGLTHKLRLMTGYISKVLVHYQNVRQTLREQMEGLPVNQESRIAVYGANEFAELVYLGLKEIGIDEITFYCTSVKAGRLFIGMPVHDISTIQSENYDKILVAELGSSEELRQELLRLGVQAQNIVTFFPTSNERDNR